jgi:hypothetical protein
MSNADKPTSPSDAAAARALRRRARAEIAARIALVSSGPGGSGGMVEAIGV